MDSLRKFRKEAALSQYMMAEFLRTTRSQVKLGEQGERPLPEIARQRLKAWEELPHQTAQKKPD
jgi:DNA-binding transcriptional regulator YiaG